MPRQSSLVQERQELFNFFLFLTTNNYAVYIVYAMF